MLLINFRKALRGVIYYLTRKHLVEDRDAAIQLTDAKNIISSSQHAFLRFVKHAALCGNVVKTVLNITVSITRTKSV